MNRMIKSKGSNKPGKNQGIAHKVFDDVVKFKTAITTDIGKFKTDVINAFNGVKDIVKDAVEKHNNLAAQVAAQEEILRQVAGFVSSKLGETNGSTEARFASIAKSVRGQDLNILAMGEVLKEVVGQLTQNDVIMAQLVENSEKFLNSNVGPIEERQKIFAKSFQIEDADIPEVKKRAEDWFKELVTSAFRTAQENMIRQEREADEAYAKELQKAKEAAEEQAKTQSLEEELRQATRDERTVSSSTSGGPGSPFPEGAEIFGG